MIANVIRKRDWSETIINIILGLLIFLMVCVFCYKPAWANAEQTIFLADRDTSYDRIIGSATITQSSYYDRGVYMSTKSDDSEATIIVLVEIDRDARAIEIDVQCRGNGKMFVVHSSISSPGKFQGNTYDLKCERPKVFYLYPASEYIDNEGNLEIHIGTDDGTLDVNYIRVKALGYRPLSTYREPRVVYDYPPTYVVTRPSIWFAVYRGPYVYWDSTLGCYVSYEGWWDRPAYVSWYRPYYERVVIPIYREYHYYFYHEVPRHQRPAARGHYAGSYWHGERGYDRGHGGGGRYFDSVNNDDHGSYAAPVKTPYVKTKSGFRRLVEQDIQRKAEAAPRRLSDFVATGKKEVKSVRTKSNLSEGTSRGTERSPRLADFLPKDNKVTGGTKARRDEVRAVKSDVRQFDRQANTDIGNFARNLRGNPTEKVHRDESRKQPALQVRPVEAARSVQPAQREFMKQRPEVQSRPQPRPRPQPTVQSAPSSSPAPTEQKKDDDKDQKKQRREHTRGRT